MARTTRKNGGAKLGEGQKGIVYDISSPDGEESLYSILQSRAHNIESITLYSLNDKISLSKQDFSPFINYIGTIHNKAAKIMKEPRPEITLKNKKSIMLKKKRIDDEIRSNIRIVNLFKKDAETYLAMNPKLVFKNTKFLSCKFVYRNPKSRMYVLFVNKCTGFKNKTNLDQLIVNILECLQIAEEKNIQHNDVKIDNIMYCDGKYKLIDWGNATFGGKMRGGLFTGPFKDYLILSSISQAEASLPLKVEKYYPELYKSDLFKSVYSRIASEFLKVINGKRINELQAYYVNHDLFALGLTILEVANREQLDYKKYSRIIDMLTSYEEPIKANVALKYVKEILTD
jgi:serine/threonine protein kinase